MAKHSGRLFQTSTVLIGKKFDVTRVVAWGLKNLNMCPQVEVTEEMVKKSEKSIPTSSLTRRHNNIRIN